MPRANRHYIPGHVWHITHRCHKKEFLLKFVKDRRRYLQWLFEAKKRFGLSVLNYMVTSNHVHLLVRDNGERDVLPSVMSHKEVVISTGGRDLLAILKHKISHFVRNDILVKELLGHNTS